MNVKYTKATILFPEWFKQESVTKEFEEEEGRLDGNLLVFTLDYYTIGALLDQLHVPKELMDYPEISETVQREVVEPGKQVVLSDIEPAFKYIEAWRWFEGRSREGIDYPPELTYRRGPHDFEILDLPDSDLFKRVMKLKGVHPYAFRDDNVFSILWRLSGHVCFEDEEEYYYVRADYLDHAVEAAYKIHLYARHIKDEIEI